MRMSRTLMIAAVATVLLTAPATAPADEDDWSAKLESMLVFAEEYETALSIWRRCTRAFTEAYYGSARDRSFLDTVENWARAKRDGNEGAYVPDRTVLLNTGNRRSTIITSNLRQISVKGSLDAIGDPLGSFLQRGIPARRRDRYRGSSRGRLPPAAPERRAQGHPRERHLRADQRALLPVQHPLGCGPIGAQPRPSPSNA